MSHSQRPGSVDTRKRNEAAGRGVRRLLTCVLSAIVVSAIALVIYGEATGAMPCGAMNVWPSTVVTPDVPKPCCLTCDSYDDRCRVCGLGNPVDLLTGALSEVVTDLSLPGIGLSWSHTRMYSSRLTAASGESLGNFQGNRWAADLVSCFVGWDDEPNPDEIHFFADPFHKRVFKWASTTDNCDTYDPPAGYRATLKHYKPSSAVSGTADSGSTAIQIVDTDGLDGNSDLVDRWVRVDFGEGDLRYRLITGYDEPNETITFGSLGGDPTDKEYKILDRVVLTFKDSGETLEFAGNNSNWQNSQKGLLRTRIDAYGNEVSYAFTTNDGGRIVSICPTAADYRIDYYYHDTGDLAGAIDKMELVKTGSPDTVLARVSYYYVGDGFYTYHADCGSTGDLAMVRVQKRATGDTGATFSIERVTQYRYYRASASGDVASHDETWMTDDNANFTGMVNYTVVLVPASGIEQSRTITSVSGTNNRTVHWTETYSGTPVSYRIIKDGDVGQLKSVFEHGALQRIVDADENTDYYYEILDMTDADEVDGKDISTYASRSFTHYTVNVNTDGQIDDTPWGDDNDLDDMYLGNSDASDFGERGYVKSETINADCAGCGGGGGAGVTRTYYYLNQNDGPFIAVDKDDVVRVVVEDTTVGTDPDSNTKIHRKLYGLNKDGILLRDVTIVNPGSEKYWCRSIIVGTSGEETSRILQRRMPSAHKDVDTDGEVATFLDPSTDTNDDDTLSTDAGLIYVYEYDQTCSGGVDGYLTGTLLKNGRSDTAFYVSATDYKDFDSSGGVKILPWKEYSYPEDDTTSRSHSSRIKTVEYYYSFHSSDPDQIETRKLTHVAVPTGENGENSEDVTAESYDSEGQLRWTINGEGHVTYYEYDDEGRLVYQVVDINTDTPPTGPNPPTPPDTPVEFDTASGLNLLTQYAYDEQGRQTKVTDPEGIVTYTVYKDNQTLVFPAWEADGGDSQSLLPIRVTETDQDGQVTEQFTVDPAEVDLDGSNLPEGMNAKDQTKYITWTRYRYTDAGQLEHVDRYHNIPAEGTGDPETDYYRTTYTYDTQGRRWKVTTPDETIAITQFDALGRAKASWMGTNDANSSVDEPDGGGAPNNMKQVSTTYYDTATSSTLVVGDGNVTRGEAYYGSGGSDYYTTDYVYDWRNRLLKTRGPNSVAVVRTLDNLGRTKEAVTYANTTFNTTSWDVESDTNANRRAKSETNYDKRGHVYQSIVHEVMPSTGDVTDSLTTKYWYDADGRLIKTQDPNTFVESTTYCLFTKNTYDGAGRLTDTYLAYDDESSYADAEDADLDGDIVIEQSKAYYDKDGRVWLTTRLRRNDNASTGHTGPLSVDADPKGRPEYAANWYDDAGRLRRTVHYGTNGGTAADVIDAKGDDFNPHDSGTQDYDYCHPDGTNSDVPKPGVSGNTTFIATDYVYGKDATTGADSIGRLYRAIDNAGRKTQRIFDDLGRVKEAYENYDNGSVGQEDHDSDRKTEYIYDEKGRLKTLIAHNPKGSGVSVEAQETRYVYGSTVNAGWVTAVAYPDTSDNMTGEGDDPWGITDGDDHVSYSYDWLGRRITAQDQRETVHEYTFDSAGRLEHDKVTNVGTGVNGYVQRITRGYDDIGRVESVTSHGHPTNDDPKNGVKFTYDGWGNVIKSQQDHNDDAGDGDLDVDYAYEDDGPGDAKYVRLDKITYPSGEEVYYNYPSTGLGVGRALSRLDNIAEDGSGTVQYAAYTYLGAGTVVKLTYPEVTDGSSRPLTLTYDPDKDSTYDGLDRFGRITDQHWRHQTSGSTGASQDRYTYVYDRNSNRIHRDATEDDQDWKYTYDGLNRLTDAQRGTLSGASLTDPQFRQNWEILEAWGNWKDFNVNENGGDTTWELEQTRKHNQVNEIDNDDDHSNDPGDRQTPADDSIEAPTGTNWRDPVHDAAGNMTYAPRPGDEGDADDALVCVYDAWNRLVVAYDDEDGEGDADAGEEIAGYNYDGLHRLIRKWVVAASPVAYYDYYYNTSWQVVEVRRNADTDPYKQYVWDIRYIDAPIVRFRDGSATEEPDETIDDTLYYIQDANFNVTAAVNDDTNAVVERYNYDPYGKVTVYDDEWAPDGDNKSNYENEILYCGYRYDGETGLYHVRHRHYHPTLGRFVQRDPIGYADGMSLYEYVQSSPLARLDPSGLTTVMGGYAPRSGKSVKITTNWCCPSEDKIIKEAVQAAYDAANSAYSAVWNWRHQPRGWTATEAETDTRIKNFFWNGWQAAKIPDTQKLTILEVLRKTRDKLADIGFSCGGTGGRCAGGAAAVERTDHGRVGGDILLCSKFFYPPVSRSDAARMILHEVTHMSAGMTDAGGGYDTMYVNSVSGGMPWYEPHTESSGTIKGLGEYRGMGTADRLKHSGTYVVFMMRYGPLPRLRISWW